MCVCVCMYILYMCVRVCVRVCVIDYQLRHSLCNGYLYRKWNRQQFKSWTSCFHFISRKHFWERHEPICYPLPSQPQMFLIGKTTNQEKGEL